MKLVYALCTNDQRIEAASQNITILDLSNILFLFKINDNLLQHLLELLDFSIANITPLKPSIPFDIPEKHKSKYATLSKWQEEFISIPPGEKMFRKYEKLCTKALKYLFNDYLNIWEEQKISNENLYRFDLICKIKNNIKDDFFETINQYFNTRYIIFDFKNYTDQITQQEIYTTEKYLYDKALRKVAIIISRKGFNHNAYKAAKGSLREQGKIILSLTDDDILQMIQMYDEGNNPSDYVGLSNISDRVTTNQL